jgi:hypothetical protein
MQHSMVLDRGSYNVTALAFVQPGGAEDSLIRALSSAARKDHFARFAGEHLCSAIARIVKQSSGASADMMNA